MSNYNRGSVLIGSLLILLGLFLTIFIFVPGLSFSQTWPLIFFILAAGFCLPPFIWPSLKQGLSGLLIPGAILAGLGLIFLYCSLTNDWAVWAYAWLLIPAWVGVGLALAATIGGWNQVVLWVGVWLMALSAGFFGLFATLFGSPLVKVGGAALVILVGIGLVLRSLKKPA